MWLFRKHFFLTKVNLVKRGWVGDASCVLCGAYEDIHHLLVNCSFVFALWNWITQYNSFSFQGTCLDDLWCIDSCITLKDNFLIELIRSVVCWIIWLERNAILFRNKSPASLKSVGMKIISLANFWCTARNTSQMFKLSIALSQRVEDFPLQIGDFQPEEVELVEEDDTPRIPSQMFGWGQTLIIVGLYDNACNFLELWSIYGCYLVSICLFLSSCYCYFV
jgi:zinc-binding in reverse transcriptase